MTKTSFQMMAALLCAWIFLVGGREQAEASETQIDYARSRLKAVGKVAELRVVNELGHREAFRIKVVNEQTIIEADSPAGTCRNRILTFAAQRCGWVALRRAIESLVTTRALTPTRCRGSSTERS